MWLALILVAIVLYALRNFYDIIHAFWLSLKIDGPPAFPIIGNALLFVNKTPAGIFSALDNVMRKYGPFSRLWIGTELSVIMQDPKDVEIILTSTQYIAKSSHYNLLRPWLNDGLLLSRGKKWHDRRKIITPAFHFKILERFVGTFDRLGNTVIEKIHAFNSIGDDGIEFFNIAGLYALDVIGETAMGVSLNALSKPDSNYVKAVKAISQVVLYRVFNVIYRNPLVFKLSKMQKIEANALQVMHQFTDDVIRKRRSELLTGGDESVDNDGDDATTGNDIGIRKKRALLDILLHSTIDDKPLTDLDIREEVDNFMFAGHDTTTSAITFTLYNIAKHPDVQRKCFNEICDIFGADAKRQQPTTLSMLNQLSYLELTIKESLRIYPSVPLISRMATEDIHLTQNRIVPKNSILMIAIYQICRNPEYYEDPDAFKPERFQSDQQSTDKMINPFAYIPFSGGQRNCIGQKFALYEIKSIVSKILLNFEVSLTKKSEVDPILCNELILRTENPIKFLFKERK